MAQQPLLALQVKPIDMPTYRGIMAERDAYRTQQNALAQQQLKQQQNAMLNQAYAEAYDPQTGRVDTNKLYGRLARGGMGAQIPGQMEAYGKGVEAAAKGGSEQFKLRQEILTVSRNELGNAQTPEEAMAAGMRVAEMYPEAADGIRQSLAKLQGMSPEQFGAWKMDALRKNLTAAQQLEQDTQTQDLGGSTRVLMRPKYGSAPFTVAPGSEAQKTMNPQQLYETQNPDLKPTTVEGIGLVGYNPRTNTYTVAGPGGGGRAPSGGGIPGERGGGTSALATNPGALKDGAFARSQPGYTGASGAFATFETPEAGVRAQENLLRGAYVGKGFNTISKIVDRYAPQGAENSAASVSNYKQYVAQQTGIDINSPISAAQVPAVAKAMREFETGQRGAAPAAAAPAQPVESTEQVATRQKRQSAARAFFDTAGIDPSTGADPVADLIKKSTSGFIERVGADIVGAIPSSLGGGATEGSKAINEIKTIAAKITFDLLNGKLGAGISNEDRKMVENMLGDIQNPNLPAGDRLAAWNRVKTIQKKYLGLDGASGGKDTGKRVVQTGTYKGRKVVKYSDGSIDYAP